MFIDKEWFLIDYQALCEKYKLVVGPRGIERASDIDDLQAHFDVLIRRLGKDPEFLAALREGRGDKGYAEA
jgi:hypothetical protein